MSGYGEVKQLLDGKGRDTSLGQEKKRGKKGPDIKVQHFCIGNNRLGSTKKKLGEKKLRERRLGGGQTAHLWGEKTIKVKKETKEKRKKNPAKTGTAKVTCN